jgi:hypothetical protein
METTKISHIDITDVPVDSLNQIDYEQQKSVHDDKITQFIQDCIKRLPYKELPIGIGWTGYVNPKRGANLADYGNCWCQDRLHRYVIVLDKYLMFQRYQNTGNIMKSPISGWSYMTLESDQLPAMYNLLKVC